MRRRLHALLAAVAGLALLAPAAHADYFSPESGGSPNADRIDTLYWIVFAIGILVYLAVMFFLVSAVVRFRHRRGAPEPAQIRGDTRLEIFMTGSAALILLVIAVITAFWIGPINDPDTTGNESALMRAGGMQYAGVDPYQKAGFDQNEPPGGKALTIRVNGQQYLWRYEYPGGDVYDYHTLIAPVDTTVVLEITSQDVQHSWWIPKLGGKFDATPGYTNKTWFKIPADQAGQSYSGQCAELCGENHAQMFARVTGVTPEQYRQYIARRTREIELAQEQLAVQRERRAGAANAGTRERN